MIRFLAVTFVAVGLGACADAAGPAFTDELTPQFAVTRNVQRISIEHTDIAPVPRGCTGELVEWHIRQEIVFSSMIDGRGGFHGSFHLHDKGSYGVGLETGARYRLAQNQVETFHITGSGTQTGTAVFLRRFISQGPMPNFRVTNIFHFTIDANGNLVSYRDSVSRICD